MAGRIRDSDIAELRDRTRIDELIGEYVALRRAGAGSLKGLCPFHDEKSPSFTVRPSHGTFHCFGCGASGDAVAFVMQQEMIGFVEAVERLADRAGFRLTYTGGGASVQRDRGTRSRLLEANRRAAEFYAEQLHTPEAEPGVAFLRARGFDAAAAARFGCGWADTFTLTVPPDWASGISSAACTDAEGGTCDVTFVAPGREGDVLQAAASERLSFGCSGLFDVTVTRADGTVLLEFRGHSRRLASPP